MAAGLDWYPTALGHAVRLSEAYALTVPQAAGILAALSPQVSWGFNLEWSEEVAQGETLSRGLTLSLGRALMIQRNPDIDPLAILGGDKVRAFYACIISGGDTAEVCIDRHACDIATGVRGSFNSLTHKRYRDTAEAYRAAARRLSATGEATLSAPQLQAITWVVWRERYWSKGAFNPRELDRIPEVAF